MNNQEASNEEFLRAQFLRLKNVNDQTAKRSGLKVPVKKES